MGMQVILMEKVANLGNLGDVVKVKDGFARNYLIPHGKAKRATPENIKHFEGRRAELEKVQNDALTKAQERAAKLENLKLQISQKAGVDGRLFGSVTNYDIVEALEKQGHEVERSQVRMPQGPLKQVGEGPIEMVLHTDVAAAITVAVIGQQERNGHSGSRASSAAPRRPHRRPRR